MIIRGVAKKLWPQVVTKEEEQVPNPTKQCEEIVLLAKQLPGEGFSDIEVDDIEELIQSHDSELTEEELIEIVKNDKNDENDDHSDSDTSLACSLTLSKVNQCLSMANDLVDFLLKEDPVMERSLKVKHEIMHALMPYKELQRKLTNESKQTCKTNYFSKQ